MYYYAYTRSSTLRQGEGVSLEVQRNAIIRYALKYDLNIIAWFEEKETAAKTGRPIFEELIHLAEKTNRGLIIHKIDRGARNLRDWAELGDLIDAGMDVRFAHDDVDLHTRGGRLSADIQAVVAADYVRNLREEARKGFYGRLNQGLLPFSAPLGYLNTGAGRAKTVDPIRGPIIRELFRMFMNHDYTLTETRNRMTDLGLRNQRGGILSLTSLSSILRNPFFTGRINLRNGESFPGIHEPLISVALFIEVQRILKSKSRRLARTHCFAYSRMMLCVCGRWFIAERQKGHVYYRCHNKCSGSIREEVIDAIVLKELQILPQAELLTIAIRQGSARQKRMIFSQLKMEIEVRVSVRLLSGGPEICCKIINRENSPQLSHILQEILIPIPHKTID